MTTDRIKQDRTFGVLNGALTNVATSMPITPDAASLALPLVAAPQIMAVVIEPGTVNEEIVWITATAAGGVAPTVVRGQESTTNVAHANGVPYIHGPTAYDHLTSPINDPAWVRVTAPNVNDDEFNTGALAAAWTQVVPSGTQSVVVGGDVCSVKVKGNTAGQLAAILKPINGLAIGNSIETASRMLSMQNYVMAGLLLTNGLVATSSCVYSMPYTLANTSTNSGENILSFRAGALNNIATDFYDLLGVGSFTGLIYQRLTWVAANSFQVFWSIDGVQWTDFGKGAFAFTLTPTHMGLGTTTWGGAQDSLAAYEYFRVV